MAPAKRARAEPADADKTRAQQWTYRTRQGIDGNDDGGEEAKRRARGDRLRVCAVDPPQARSQKHHARRRDEPADDAAGEQTGAAERGPDDRPGEAAEASAKHQPHEEPN